MSKWIEIKTENQIQDITEIVPIERIVHLSKHGGTDPKILFNLEGQYQVYCSPKSIVTGHDVFANEHIELKYEDISAWVMKKMK